MPHTIRYLTQIGKMLLYSHFHIKIFYKESNPFWNEIGNRTGGKENSRAGQEKAGIKLGNDG